MDKQQQHIQQHQHSKTIEEEEEEKPSASDGDPKNCEQSKQQRPRVVHSYHDYSETMDDRGTAGNSKTRESMDRNFVEKLHYMLSDMEQENLEHIAAWQPHGRCFIVRQTDHFETKILPLWFRQTKFASFQRQLNLYGFNRITSGLDKHAYYHELFLRSKAFLAKRILRIKVKGNGGRKASSPKSEPNFYQMPYLPPSYGISKPSLTTQPQPARVTSQFVQPTHDALNVPGASNLLAGLLLVAFQQQQGQQQQQSHQQLPQQQPTQAQQLASQQQIAQHLFQMQLQQQQSQLGATSFMAQQSVNPGSIAQPGAPVPNVQPQVTMSPNNPQQQQITDPRVLANLNMLMSLVPTQQQQQQTQGQMPTTTTSSTPLPAQADVPSAATGPQPTEATIELLRRLNSTYQP